jgi:hypothetical protein
MSYGGGLSIGDSIRMQQNHNQLISELRDMNNNMTDYQRYARELEGKVSKLELKLKETREASMSNWFASMTRKALFTAAQLWIQKFDEAPVSKDLNDVKKNHIENSTELNDEQFLQLVQQVLRMIIADASNDRKDNVLYVAYEQYAKDTVVNSLHNETRAEKWKIEKVLEEKPLRPEDRELEIVKKIGASEPFSIIGPLAMEML